MNRDNLYRSLEANRDFYADRFISAPTPPEHNGIKKTGIILGFYEEAMEISQRVQKIEADMGHKYSPDQPRDDHGRWTSGGGTTGASSGENPGDDGDDQPQSAKNFSISQDGVNFIASHEDFSPSVYPDQAGKPTIGYGHLIQPGESFPNGVTQDQAQQLLANDLNTAEQAVRDDVTVPITQNQFDALTSLAYNIGGGSNGFAGSTVLQLLNQGDYNRAADHFADWNKVTNPLTGLREVSQGLVNRRNAEQNIFLNGIYP